MKYALFRRQALCVGLLLAGAAAPVWAETTVPFKHYQGWRDAPVADWRAVNDRVGEVGGWRTYLRESQPAGGAGHDHGAPQPQTQAPGDAGRHDHHGHHGHHHGH